MRYAVGKISLVVVVGAVVSAAGVNAQPARPTALNARDSRGMVLMVQWSRRVTAGSKTRIMAPSLFRALTDIRRMTAL